jgi:hypothetical protein
LAGLKAYRRIFLTQDQVTLVSLEDFQDRFGWYAMKMDGEYVAARKVWHGSTRVNEYMARRIMQAPEGVQVDHKNGNHLDNRRLNLRLATNQQNQCNRGPQCNNTSGYKGVTWHKYDQRWKAQIWVNQKNHNLGSFDDPVEAAKAYDAAALELHGRFARLNFPVRRVL